MTSSAPSTSPLLSTRTQEPPSEQPASPTLHAGPTLTTPFPTQAQCQPPPGPGSATSSWRRVCCLRRRSHHPRISALRLVAVSLIHLTSFAASLGILYTLYQREGRSRNYAIALACVHLVGTLLCLKATLVELRYGRLPWLLSVPLLALFGLGQLVQVWLAFSKYRQARWILQRGSVDHAMGVQSGRFSAGGRLARISIGSSTASGSGDDGQTGISRSSGGVTPSNLLTGTPRHGGPRRLSNGGRVVQPNTQSSRRPSFLTASSLNAPAAKCCRFHARGVDAVFEGAAFAGVVVYYLVTDLYTGGSQLDPTVQQRLWMCSCISFCSAVLAAVEVDLHLSHIAAQCLEEKGLAFLGLHFTARATEIASRLWTLALLVLFAEVVDQRMSDMIYGSHCYVIVLFVEYIITLLMMLTRGGMEISAIFVAVPTTVCNVARFTDYPLNLAKAARKVRRGFLLWRSLEYILVTLLLVNSVIGIVPELELKPIPGDISVPEALEDLLSGFRNHPSLAIGGPLVVLNILTAAWLRSVLVSCARKETLHRSAIRGDAAALASDLRRLQELATRRSRRNCRSFFGGRPHVGRGLDREPIPDLERVGVEGLTPLQLASRGGFDNAVVVLIQYRADVSKAAVKDDGETDAGLLPIHLAARNGSEPTVKALLRAAADASATAPVTGETPLMFAAALGHDSCLRRCMNSPGGMRAVMATTAAGDTAIHFAALRGHTACLHTLIWARANPYQSNNSGVTPLMVREPTSTAALAAHAGGSPRQLQQQQQARRQQQQQQQQQQLATAAAAASSSSGINNPFNNNSNNDQNNTANNPITSMPSRSPRASLSSSFRGLPSALTGSSWVSGGSRQDYALAVPLAQDSDLRNLLPDDALGPSAPSQVEMLRSEDPYHTSDNLSRVNEQAAPTRRLHIWQAGWVGGSRSFTGFAGNGPRMLEFEPTGVASLVLSASSGAVGLAMNWGTIPAHQAREDMAVIRRRTTPNQENQLAHYQIIQVVGEGNFGIVYEVKARDLDVPLALKILHPKKYAKDINMREKAWQEREVLKAARHPFIVQLFSTFRTPAEEFALVMEYCPNGDLNDFIIRNGTPGIHMGTARRLLAEILMALEHLHDVLDVIYRDLKPENVVLDMNLHAKLTDFGLAKGNIRALGGTFSFVGSAHFVAPEVQVLEHPYAFEVDLYCLGLVSWIVFTGGISMSVEFSEGSSNRDHSMQSPPEAIFAPHATMTGRSSLGSRREARVPPRHHEELLSDLEARSGSSDRSVASGACSVAECALPPSAVALTKVLVAWNPHDRGTARGLRCQDFFANPGFPTELNLQNEYDWLDLLRNGEQPQALTALQPSLPSSPQSSRSMLASTDTDFDYADDWWTWNPLT